MARPWEGQNTLGAPEKRRNEEVSDLSSGFKAAIISFVHPDLVKIVNIQARGNQAKPYQVRQIRQLILRYGLGDEV